MKGFVKNIREIVNDNVDFRHVIYTAKHSQLVLMCLQPGEEIGLEVHNENDQFFLFEAGSARVVIDDNTQDVSEGFVALVPAGAKHNVINTSQTNQLRLLTMYMPPHHQDGIVRSTKSEAEANEAEFDGQTSE